MEPRLPLTLSLFTLLPLAGCVATVKVTHLAPPEALGEAARGRTARVYVLVKGRPSADLYSGALEKLSDTLQKRGADRDKALSRALTPEEREALGRGAAGVFAAAGAPAAYQVAYGDEPPAAMAEFAPTASLWIEPQEPAARQESFEVEVSSVEKKTRWRVVSAYAVAWQLRAEPEGAVLAAGRVPADGAEVKAERDHKTSDLEAVLRDRARAAAAALPGALRTALLPHPVERHRTLHKGRGLVLDGYRRFEKGDWDGAAALWRQAAERDPADGLARHHLGVHYERQGRWQEARAEYLQTQGLNRAQAQEVATALAQLDAMAPPAGVAPSRPLFLGQRLAVLPFENESVDVNAPAYARLRAQEMLEQRGYNLVPAAEVDARLRELGITEGGQLRMTLEATLARALGAERLLFGTVEEFRAVNVGLYSRRQVRLALRITDGGGRELWRNRAQVLEQEVEKPKQAVRKFLLKLASTQFEKILNVYLQEETDEALARNLELLPRYVAPEGR